MLVAMPLSTPNLNLWVAERKPPPPWAFIRPPVVATTHARGPLEAPLDVNVYGSYGASGALSLGKGR